MTDEQKLIQVLVRLNGLRMPDCSVECQAVDALNRRDHGGPLSIVKSLCSQNVSFICQNHIPYIADSYWEILDD